MSLPCLISDLMSNWYYPVTDWAYPASSLLLWLIDWFYPDPSLFSPSYWLGLPCFFSALVNDWLILPWSISVLTLWLIRLTLLLLWSYDWLIDFTLLYLCSHPVTDWAYPASSMLLWLIDWFYPAPSLI
jgi:hypothetical protein